MHLSRINPFIFSLFSSCSTFMCEKIIDELVYSFNTGTFDYHSHAQLLDIASSVNKTIIHSQPLKKLQQEQPLSSSLLSFLFLLVPNYILSTYANEFILSLVNATSREEVFFSQVYPLHQQYSSWFFAGLHRFIKYPSQSHTAFIQTLCRCLQQMGGYSLFFLNLSTHDIFELYSLYSLRNEEIATIFANSPILEQIHLIHTLFCTKEQFSSLFAQYFSNPYCESKSAVILKQALKIMKAFSHFVCSLSTLFHK